MEELIKGLTRLEKDTRKAFTAEESVLLEKAIDALKESGKPHKIIAEIPASKIESVVKAAVEEFKYQLYNGVVPDSVIEIKEAKAIKERCIKRICNGCPYRSIVNEYGCMFANCPDSWDIPEE